MVCRNSKKFALTSRVEKGARLSDNSHTLQRFCKTICKQYSSFAKPLRAKSSFLSWAGPVDGSGLKQHGLPKRLASSSLGQQERPDFLGHRDQEWPPNTTDKEPSLWTSQPVGGRSYPSADDAHNHLMLAYISHMLVTIHPTPGQFVRSHLPAGESR